MLIYWQITKDTFKKFFAEDIFTWAAALAYYTAFSLPPIILIIIYTTSLIYDESEIQQLIFSEIGNLVGERGAQQLSATVNKMYDIEGNFWVVGMSIGILIFTSTTVFVTMQSALNNIFDVKAKATMGFLKLIKDRLLSFALVLGIAFILLISLTINALVTAFSNYLFQLMPGLSLVLLAIMSVLLPFIVTTFLFALIFRFLPDVHLRWRHATIGAILTTILFSLGKYAIGFYIGNSDVSSFYDAAGSLLVLLVWVFYASVIFLFGGVFTAIYTKAKGEKVKPETFAVKVKKKMIEQPPGKA